MLVFNLNKLGLQQVLKDRFVEMPPFGTTNSTLWRMKSEWSPSMKSSFTSTLKNQQSEGTRNDPSFLTKASLSFSKCSKEERVGLKHETIKEIALLNELLTLEWIPRQETLSVPLWVLIVHFSLETTFFTLPLTECRTERRKKSFSSSPKWPGKL